MTLDDVTERLEHRVTFSETDGLGFVHHRCAAVWFEQSRERFFRRFGMPAKELFTRGWYLALRELNVRYENFIAYDDALQVRVALTHLGRVALDFHYRVDNLTTGKVALRGHTNLVAVDARPGEAPSLGRIRFDRGPFEKCVVTPEQLFGNAPGSWARPRWEADVVVPHHP